MIAIDQAVQFFEVPADQISIHGHEIRVRRPRPANMPGDDREDIYTMQLLAGKLLFHWSDGNTLPRCFYQYPDGSLHLRPPPPPPPASKEKDKAKENGK